MNSNSFLPSSSSSAMHISHVSTHSQLNCKDLPFAPILPYTTQSNLGAMYLLGSELGRGQCGIIRNCTRRSSGALYACKSISKLRVCDVKDVVREVRIMKSLCFTIPSHASPTSHTSPHNCSLAPGGIVRLYDVIEDKEFVHLIMELCHGGELFDRIVKKKCYPEAQAAFIIKSLLEIVQFCHSKGIMHRDIKPENILLLEDSDTSPIKLAADFGLALEFSPGQKFSGIAGSTYYIAPEVLQGEYSEEVDMWSAGVILYVLLSGVPPFSGATEQRIFKAIQKGDLSFPPNPWDSISSAAKDLISKMLHANAKLRLAPAQALKHRWILHHSKFSGHVQSNSTSRTLSIPKNAGNLGSHTSTFAPTHNQTLLWSGMGNVDKPELNRILADMIACKDRNTCSVSNSFHGQRLQSGWTCTVLSLKETLVVDMGQKKYLVSHDKIKKNRMEVVKGLTISQIFPPFHQSY